MNSGMLLLVTALSAGSGLGGVPASAPQEERVANGSFDVQVTRVEEEAFAGGHEIGRYHLTKQYHGDLVATAEGEMLTASTSVAGSAGYVAIERVVGSLGGRSGSFLLQHSGAMSGETRTLTITVVPDSGTEELEGLAGTLGIEILDDGQHLYEFRYAFAGQGTLPLAKDEAGIHAFWSTLDETWASRDADRFGRLFSEDASFAFVDRGESLEGRAAIHQRFTEQFSRQRPELRHRTTVQQIRPLAEDVMAVDGEVRVLEESSGGDATVLRRFAISAVMVREEETWQVHLLRAYPLSLQSAETRPSRTSPAIGGATVQAIKHADTEVVVTRTFAATREAVFDALTQPEHLVHWMQAAAMQLVDCEADVRTGGSFRYVYRRASGTRIEVRGQYSEVNPPHRFAFTESYDFSPLEIEVTVDLDEADGKTAFRQTLRYATRERDRDFDGVVGSAREAYPKLDRYLGELGQR